MQQQSDPNDINAAIRRALNFIDGTAQQAAALPELLHGIDINPEIQQIIRLTQEIKMKVSLSMPDQNADPAYPYTQG